jgi:hypothetical protein
MRMKLIVSLSVMLALTAAAAAQDAQHTKDAKGIKSPWSGSVTDQNIGGVGARTSTLKRDVGDGWSIGGQVTTKYQDPALGGNGPPREPLGGSRNTTIFGPYLEKKF